MKIFFSHSSKDKSLVREIKAKMYHFLDIWLDEKELLPGENLSNELDNHVKTADLVILFISPNSISSEWVKNEMNWSIQRESSLGRPFLIPIQIGNCSIPNELVGRLYMKLNSQFEADVNSLSLDLNKYIFQLVLKYGIYPTTITTQDNKTKKSKDDKVDFILKMLHGGAESQLKPYRDIVTSNVELTPTIILLLLEDEARNTIIDTEENESMLKKETENSDENQYINLKSMLNDQKIKIAKKIIQKLEFIKNNAGVISAEEGLYMMKKHIEVNPISLDK